MIEDLINQYDALREQGKAAGYGEDSVNIPYAVCIDDEGMVVHIDTLGDTTQKRLTNKIIVPLHGGRQGSKPKGMPLWDNAKYLLGDPIQDPDKAMACFEAEAKVNIDIFKNVDNPAARAIVKYFSRPPQWEKAREQFGEEAWKKMVTSNFILSYDGRPLNANPSIMEACQRYVESGEVDKSRLVQSVASGEMVLPVPTHPLLRGVPGAQSSGAALISYNFKAACSYGHEKCFNAPMSEREAFKYTSALKAMLPKDSGYCCHLGDIIILTWAQSGEPEYSRFFNLGAQLNTGGNEHVEIEDVVIPLMKKIVAGEPCEFKGVTLRSDQHFFILALAPNAARLAVSFYYKDSFGNLLSNVNHHYLDIAIERPSFDKWKNPPVWKLLYAVVRQKSKNKNPSNNTSSTARSDATVNPRSKEKLKNKNASNELTNAVMRAVLTDAPYPATLLNAVRMRIRAEREITADRAAIIKGYYARLARLGRTVIANNPHADKQFKEVLQMNINKESDYVPYVLGRMFSVYEQIQEAANPKINATIKDRYFNSACATPAYIFPVLGDLSQAHLRKLKRTNPGALVNLTKELESLAARVGEHYPSRLTIQEQGAFQLGYYWEDREKYERARKTAEAKTNVRTTAAVEE